MRITVILCIGYWLFLTVLLLVPNPAALLGLKEVPSLPWGKFGIHLLAFTILSVLVHSLRWPKRLAWSPLVFLAIYAVATEFSQRFVFPRTARVMDGLENLLGIALGAAIYWSFRRLFASSPSRPSADWFDSEEEALKYARLSRIGHKRDRMRS
jgi:glycopeptide antibiotics resistance protein